MPDLYRMPLVNLGTFVAPRHQRDPRTGQAIPLGPGEVQIDRRRVRHWIDQFQRIKSEGNRVPTPWGHQLAAVPFGDADALRYAQARWNAGTVERLEENPRTGGLDVVGTVPPGYVVERDRSGRETGRLVNERDGTIVTGMSAGIAPRWRDGKGKVWEDVIVHAALCPLPVVADQGAGFTSTLSTAGAARPGEPEFLTSLGTGIDEVFTLGTIGTSAMKDKGKAEPDGDEIDDGTPDSPDMPDTGTDLPPLPAMDAAPATPALPMATPDGKTINDIVALAGAVKLPLPPDTTPQNFVERLKVTLSTLASLGWTFQAPQNGMPGGGGTGAPAKLDSGPDGAAKPEGMNPATAFMSTELDATGAFGLVMLGTEAAAVADAWAQQTRESYAARLDELQARGLSESVVKREKLALSRARPAIDRVTKRVSLPESRDRIASIQEAFAPRAEAQAALTRPARETPAAAVVATLSLNGATPEANPARPASGSTETPADLKSFLIQSAGLRPLPAEDAK